MLESWWNYLTGNGMETPTTILEMKLDGETYDMVHELKDGTIINLDDVPADWLEGYVVGGPKQLTDFGHGLIRYELSAWENSTFVTGFSLVSLIFSLFLAFWIWKKVKK